MLVDTIRFKSYFDIETGLINVHCLRWDMPVTRVFERIDSTIYISVKGRTLIVWPGRWFGEEV